MGVRDERRRDLVCGDRNAVEASSPPAAVATPAAAPVSMARIGDDLAAPDDSDHQAFEALLRDAVERGASDIHIHAGAPGTPGPVVFPLAGGPTVWSGTAGPLTPPEEGLLISG